MGYSQELFILPFDHRGSFRKLIPDSLISSYKEIIYQGFQKALVDGVPKNKAGILVDEQFGDAILRDARAHDFLVACTVEKSGREEFEFEYGEEFEEHLQRFRPTFAKALVRFNPDSDPALNDRQARRLRELSDYCGKHPIKLMLELLVPATEPQLESMNESRALYDLELRPALMVRAMKSLQEAGIRPDVWKVEGVRAEADLQRLVQQARSVGDPDVGLIILGRGESIERVREWIDKAAKVHGFIGFAIGRTLFWDPLQGVKDEKWSHERAAHMIAGNYRDLCDLWESSRGKRIKRS